MANAKVKVHASFSLGQVAAPEPPFSEDTL